MLKRLLRVAGFFVNHDIGGGPLHRNIHRGGKAVPPSMNDDEYQEEGPEYEVGLTFEKFVKGMFLGNPDFKILFWSEGKWTKVPDFYVQYGQGRQAYKFWVEARYKQEPFKKKVKIFGDRSDRWNLLHAFQGIVLPERVFVVLGLGGGASNPDRLFRIPVLEIPHPDLYLDIVERYQCGRSFEKYENYTIV
jgi:hypothetical protein